MPRPRLLLSLVHLLRCVWCVVGSAALLLVLSGCSSSSCCSSSSSATDAAVLCVSGSPVLLSDAGFVLTRSLFLHGGVDVGAALEHLTSRIDAHDATLILLQQEIDLLRADNALLQANLTSAQTLLQQQSLTVGSLLATDANTTATLATLQTNMTSLYAEASWLHSDIESLQLTVSSELPSLQSSAQEFQSNLSALARAIASLTAVNSLQATNLTAFATRLVSVEDLTGSTVLALTVNAVLALAGASPLVTAVNAALNLTGDSPLVTGVVTANSALTLSGSTALVTAVIQLQHQSGPSALVANLHALNASVHAALALAGTSALVSSVNNALNLTGSSPLVQSTNNLLLAGTWQGNDTFDTGFSCTATARNALLPSPCMPPITIVRDGTYAVLGMARVINVNISAGDVFWSATLIRIRAGVTSTLEAVTSGSVMLATPRIGEGDNGRSLHWVGALKAEDQLQMQYQVIGNTNANESPYSIFASINGSNRLSVILLKIP